MLTKISKMLAVKMAMIAFPGERDKQNDLMKLWDISGYIANCPPELCELCELKSVCRTRV